MKSLHDTMHQHSPPCMATFLRVQTRPPYKVYQHFPSIQINHKSVNFREDTHFHHGPTTSPTYFRNSRPLDQMNSPLTRISICDDIRRLHPTTSRQAQNWEEVLLPRLPMTSLESSALFKFFVVSVWFLGIGAELQQWEISSSRIFRFL